MTLSACIVFASCQTTPVEPDTNPDERLVELPGEPGSVLTVQEKVDAASGAGISAPVTRDSREMIYGTQSFYEPLQTGDLSDSSRASGSDGESFNFRNAPIDAVLNEVLGESFGLNYSLAPDIRGQISLRLDGIKTADEAVASLGAALGLQNLEIVETGGSYLVGRKGASTGQKGDPVFLDSQDNLPAGTSLAVLQIRYANLQDITELARAMLQDGIIRHTDDARGFIVLEGEPQAVASAIDLLKSLDVNWLSSVSTALIPVHNALPSEIALISNQLSNGLAVCLSYQLNGWLRSWSLPGAGTVSTRLACGSPGLIRTHGQSSAIIH